MKFWIATCRNKDLENEEILFIASDDAQKKTKIKKDLMLVHPEFIKVTLRKGSRPDSWVLFEGVI